MIVCVYGNFTTLQEGVVPIFVHNSRVRFGKLFRFFFYLCRWLHCFFLRGGGEGQFQKDFSWITTVAVIVIFTLVFRCIRTSQITTIDVPRKQK